MTSSSTDTLKVLCILHYVLGGFTALFASLPLIHIVIGVALVTGSLPATDETLPSLFGWFFVVFPGLLLLAGWTLAILILVAGVKLGGRKGRTYCLVVAMLESMMFPFGTALGVTTLILLLQDENAALFKTPPHA